ncbi:MAG TPA: response regulator transcription factor [Blastocatellia bacterium]|nr:response regulator transcription factor [Blastocatellia bacterium]
MQILIAEDDSLSRRLLEVRLTNWGYDVIITENGEQAWGEVQKDSAPRLAIMDWMMPQMDGLEVCRRIRARNITPYIYVILLTARDSKEDITQGLAAGADDYILKPFDHEELLARIKVGERILSLEHALSNKVVELEQALAQVHQLKELLPICMFCKKIRDDQDYWHQIEHYLHAHAGTDFSHGICPECYEKWSKSRQATQPSTESKNDGET